MSKKFLNFFVFLLIPVFLFGNFFSSILVAKADANKTIVITFASAPSSATATVTPLKYNKDFAYSYFFDDGLGSAYDFAFKYLNGGFSTSLNQDFGGLYFTDGAGNNVPFRAGHAFYSRTSKGTATSTPAAYSDLHTSDVPTAYNIGWGNLQETVDYGWDLFNHGWTSASEDYTGQLFYGNWPAHGTSTLDYAYELSQQEVEVAAKIFLKNNAGATTTPFSHTGVILPNGDANYFQPALDYGTKIMYSTSNNNIPAISVRYANLNSSINLNPSIFPGRLFNYDSAFDSGGLFDYVDGLATQSINGTNLFGAAFTHQLTTSTDPARLSGGMSWTRWKSLMDHIETSYGRFGEDNAWVAGGQEVYEYQVVKQNVGVTTNLVGNQLTVEIDTTNVPANLRHYALSLLISSNTAISSVSYGAGFTGHSENKTTGLINVEWGENSYAKNDITRVNDLTTLAETTRLQVDIDKANTYLNMLQDQTTRGSLQSRLQNIDVAGNKWNIQLLVNGKGGNTRNYIHVGSSENWNRFEPSNTTSPFTGLKDTNGNSTSLAISVPVIFIPGFENVTTTSGVYPANILSSGMSTTATTSRTVVISGLNQNNKYKVSVFGARFRSGYTYKNSLYTVNGATSTLNVNFNADNAAVFANVIPDTSGNINISVTQDTIGGSLSGGHLNALKIEEQFNKKPSITINNGTQPSLNKSIISYSIADPESDASSLSSFQYSLTGSWSGEQATATPLVSDPAHNGIASLSSSPSGVAHNFVWDLGADLSNDFYGYVYFRMTPTDPYAGEGWTGLSNSFYIDKRALSVSNFNASSSPSSTVITWNTNKSASTQVEYGLGSWYGYFSTKKDEASRVSSHTETLSNLPTCSVFQYRTISDDEFGQQASSTIQQFSTTNCLGNANIATSSSSLISTVSGGSSTLTSSNGQIVSLHASSSYASGDSIMQIKELATSSVLAVAPIATSTRLLGGIFSFSSFLAIDNPVTNFNNNLNLSFSYQDADVAGVNPSSLQIKFWNTASSSWEGLNNCVVDIVAKTVTCPTNHFSEFALFGEEAATPAAPSGLFSIPTDGEVSLSWLAPNDGGSPITGYQIEYRLTGSSTWHIWSENATTTHWSSNRLTPRISYDFVVKAVNAIGVGPASNLVSVTVASDELMLITGLSKAESEATISWNTTFFSTTKIEYGLSVAYGSSTVEKNLNPLTLNHQDHLLGLSSCTTYHFRLLGTDSLGNQIASPDYNLVTIGCLPPSPPTNTSALRGNGQGIISFNPSSSAGSSPITGYTVISSPGNLSVTGSSSPITVSGLNNGTAYTFIVVANNSIGSSSSSTPTNQIIPATTPGSPTNVVATRGNGQATIAFLAPNSNGGLPIISYTAVSSPGGFSASASSSPILVTGLSNGTAYTFTVKATNEIGDSSFSSASSVVTPATTPSAPRNLVVTPGNSEAALSWEAPLNTGGSNISNYQLEYKQSSSGSWNVFSLVSSASSSAIVNGLTNSISYDFRVIAINAIGASVASNIVSDVRLASVAGAPTDLSATMGNGQISLTWTEPINNGGVPITNYYLEYKLSSAGEWLGILGGESTTAIISSLVNGSAYDFRVSAINVTGTSSPSEIVSMTPGNTPSAPLNVSATRGNGQASVSFSAPVNNGGSAITSYTVISNPGSLSVTGTSSPIVISGLNNGTSYTFTVFASNQIGNSVSSQASTPIVPATTPGAPTNLGVTVNENIFNLSWQAPANNGGATVSSYNLEYHVQFSYPFSPYTWLPLASTTNNSFAVSGLTSGINYAFRVKSVNSVGEGSPSETATAVLGGSVFSNLSLVSSSTSAQINWTTGSLASTEINYGLTDNYGLDSTLKDFDSMVLNHSENLQNLLPCTIYHYRLSAYDSLGNNSVSGDNTFSTTGCFAAATPITNLNFTVPVSSGTSTAFTWESGRLTTLSFPSGSANDDFQVQVFRLASSSVVTTHPAPADYLILGDTFQINAYQNNLALNHFAQPLNLKMSYQDGELNHLNELSLAVFSWNGASWEEVSGCSLNATNNFISCNVSDPGIFAIFGQNYQPSSLVFGSINQNATTSVNLNYLVKNSDSEPTNLLAYEFSSTGVFNGEKRTMTPKTNDQSHEGILNLDSSPAGVSHRFVWDSASDLSPNFAGAIYFRLTPFNALAGTGTPVIASSTFDFRAPVLGTISVASITPQTAMINWTTDEAASTQIEYGLTMNYGNASLEKDNVSRVTSHSDNLTNLVACSRYYYRVRSLDVFGNEYLGSTRSLMTSGCLGGAAIKNTGQSTVSNSAGGSAALSGQLSVSLPSSFASSTVDLQLNQLDGSAALVAAPIGASQRLVPDKIFDIKAFADASSTISVLSEAGSIEMLYTSADIVNINEDSLSIYYWNSASSTWDVLSGCVRNKSLKKVTCAAPHFSVFALLGDYVASTPTPTGGGGGGGGGSSVNYSLLRKPSSGQFKFLINNGAASTISNILSISLDGGPDAYRYLISEKQDFSGAVANSYSTSTLFTSSPSLGEKNIYLKFGNYYNYFSEVLVAKINLVSGGELVNVASSSIPSFFVGETTDEELFGKKPGQVIVKIVKLEPLKTILSPGNKGVEVKKLQDFLISQNLLAKDANTSFYGAQTRIAIEKFQVKHKITSAKIYGYGLCGLATKNKINSLINELNQKIKEPVTEIKEVLNETTVTPVTINKKLEPLKTILSPGNKGVEVKKLQDFLISQNLLAKDANTSFYGTQTRTAIEKFQIKHKIISAKIYGYGLCGLATKNKINSLINELNKQVKEPVSLNPGVGEELASSSLPSFFVGETTDEELFGKKPEQVIVKIVKLEPLKTVLSPGNKGVEVKKLQDFLISQNLLAKDANTSFYGAQTRTAIEKFQIKEGIIKNRGEQGFGIFGPATLQVVNRMLLGQ